MTPEQRAAALRLADYHDQFQLGIGKETADLLRALAAEQLKAPLSMHGKQAEPVIHLYECLGRWASMLAHDGLEADLALPEWLTAAITAATKPAPWKNPGIGSLPEPVAWLTRDAQDGLWHATAQRKSSEDRPLYLRPPQDTALREENERLRGIVPEVLEKLNDDLCDENAKLREAAQAVVERWDTPNWKDAEPTAAVIERLRGVLEAK